MKASYLSGVGKKEERQLAQITFISSYFKTSCILVYLSPLGESRKYVTTCSDVPRYTVWPTLPVLVSLPSETGCSCCF